MGLMILVAILVVVFCMRAANADHRAQRIGFYALASGSAAFEPIIFAANYLPADRVSAFVASAIIATLLALAGMILSIRTLLVRRGNGGVAIGIPIVGLLFGLVGSVLGIGIYVIGGRVIIPGDEQQRTWRCEEHSFEVTIPSERWQKQSNSNVLGEFRSSRPSLFALVADARPGATAKEFEAALAFGSKMQTDTPGDNTFEQKGKNAFGNEYWIYMGDAKSAKNEQYFFGFSITHVRDKAIIMLVEGHYNMQSQIGHSQESEALRAQAKVFLGSAR